jgi:hypothetical protein
VGIDPDFDPDVSYEAEAEDEMGLTCDERQRVLDVWLKDEL